MKKTALIVLTGHDKLGDTGEKTGWHLSEASHVFWPLINDGFKVDFASPEGGPVAVDPSSLKLDDPENKSFVERFKMNETLNTHAVSEIKARDYGIIYFAGGHGTMWDFPENQDIQRLVSEIYEAGGIVGAVCHGPAALVNVKLSDDSYLVEGKSINSFTDAEEREVEKEDVVPFLLETKLRERGGNFLPGDKWANQVVVDERLITGQNPQSASTLGQTLVKEFAKLRTEGGARSTSPDRDQVSRA